MVGVPKSKRCTFCKARKTKCDEKWPTCGACARAGKICSGARNSFKFVVNGSHNEPTNHAAITIDLSRIARDRTSRGQVGGGDLTDDARGGPISRFRWEHIVLPRPYTAELRHLPSNPKDRLAARLVGCLESAPRTGNDLCILGAFLPLIPQQLVPGNRALYSAVELILDSWTSCRRGLPPEQWLDLRAYNRAIRSLNDVLHDRDPEMIGSTFAAQCLLQKAEILYDFKRGSNQETHGAGLIAVIAGPGLGWPMTEMTLHVLFEGIYHMLQEDIRQNRESFFNSPECHSALFRAIESSHSKPILKQLYSLWVVTTVWPGLVRLTRLLGEDSTPNKIAVAEVLHARASSLAEFLQRQEDNIISALVKSGDVAEVDNSHDMALFPKSYEFRDYLTSRFFNVHATVSIIACRALQEANRISGHYDPTVEEQARRSSKRIWMSFPWLRHQMPLAVDYTASLAFSYESGNEEERRYCIEGLRRLEKFRHPPPVGEWVDATIMANTKAFTGRLPFIKTQDLTVELEGIGCRC
ncbi:hypothetical protein GGS20DRAFT_599362 [Poronia punctata]|nr:hypothetical protein GGS20DRAFT_599362 [Poronia punctata]